MDYVKALIHPDVTDVARAILDAIARLIPEGETTTLLIRMQVIADLARVHRRTVWEWMPVLVEMGEVQVVDGGQGRQARYTLVHVAGAPPVTAAPLPLVGATPRRKPIRQPDTSTPDLFGPPLVRSESEELVITRITRITSWARRSITRITSWWPQGTITSSTTCDPCDPDGSASIDRARDVLSDLSSSSVVVGAARPREPADDFLDWFEASYPPYHRGARCTVRRARDGPLVRELLDGGRPLERLQAMALVMWALTTDGIIDSDRWWIAEIVTVRDIFVLHRKANFLDGEVARRDAESACRQSAAADDVWAKILKRVEVKINRHSFYSWFKPTVLVSDNGAVIQVAGGGGEDGQVLADWIQKHYRAELEAAVQEVRPGTRVEFVTDAREKYG